MLARCRCDAEGANAVEFALVLPVLILLLFGTMYGASLFNSQQTINQAAREGARFGATLPLSEFGGSAPPAEGETEWFEEVEARALRILQVDRPLTPGDVSVCVRFYTEDGTSSDNDGDACPDPSPSDGQQGARVEVAVTRGARLELGLASIGPLTLSSSAVARYEPKDLDELDGGED